ncbi:MULTISPECIES: helix-turn-helix transcriptional regulator [Burkholderia cepacia complex]|uniref:helix-turn-helix transcriptional regulator n=1 Tax=Burkholderia cepacia complex TaxID=87882 RepID=UPI00069F7561|nr:MULTISPECIES: LuxR family transcriptional regulator [Burkholderia cepacia complex]
MNHLDKLIELVDCKTVDSWASRLFSLVESFGLAGVVYGIKRSKAAEFSSAFIKTNLSTTWLHRYEHRQFYGIDPIIDHCMRHKLPLIWDERTYVTPIQRVLYEDAFDHGLRSGIAFPVHGPDGQFGVSSFVSNEANAGSMFACKKLHASLSMLSDYATETSIAFSASHFNSNRAINLTARELECLTLLGIGKTSWEISRILTCSEATVNFHVYNLIRKFGVRTRQQAVIKGICHGLIAPT